MDWGVAAARELASAHLDGNEPRWSHVRGVGALAERLAADGLVSEQVTGAAWLHDIGYAPRVVDTGFHALDGARFLVAQGAPDELVGLVAHHTGAEFEADERGLAGELRELPCPTPTNLEAVTLVDLVVSPRGRLIAPEQRLAEVLKRYGRDDPVFHAIFSSRAALLAAATNARQRLGLPDEWPFLVAECMAET